MSISDMSVKLVTCTEHHYTKVINTILIISCMQSLMVQHEIFIVKSSPTKLTSKARSAMLLSNMLLNLVSSMRRLLLLTIPMHYPPVVVKTTTKFKWNTTFVTNKRLFFPPLFLFSKSCSSYPSFIVSENIFNEHAYKLVYSMQDQVNKSNITVLISMTRFSFISIYVRWDIIRGAVQ